MDSCVVSVVVLVEVLFGDFDFSDEHYVNFKQGKVCDYCLGLG